MPRPDAQPASIQTPIPDWETAEFNHYDPGNPAQPLEIPADAILVGGAAVHFSLKRNNYGDQEIVSSTLSAYFLDNPGTKASEALLAGAYALDRGLYAPPSGRENLLRFESAARCEVMKACERANIHTLSALAVYKITGGYGVSLELPKLLAPTMRRISRSYGLQHRLFPDEDLETVMTWLTPLVAARNLPSHGGLEASLGPHLKLLPPDGTVAEAA